MEEMKLCSKCGELKVTSEFSKCTSSKDGLQPKCKICAKEYRQANKEAISVYQVAHYQANKETITIQQAEYKQANKDALVIYQAEYYLNNKDALSVQKAEYAKTPKGKLMSRNAYYKRRAICKGGDVTTEQLQELVRNSPNCHYCKCAITDGNRHIDHYIPLSRGGLHTLDNLVIACSTCNLRKGSKMPEEFIGTLRKLKDF